MGPWLLPIVAADAHPSKRVCCSPVTAGATVANRTASVAYPAHRVACCLGSNQACVGKESMPPRAWLGGPLMQESAVPSDPDGQELVTNGRPTGDLVQLAHDHIREAILAGEYEPGELLRLARLTRDVGTSAIPIREALRRLEGERLVEVLPNRGARVAPIGIDDVIGIYRVRILLESEAVRLAVGRLLLPSSIPSTAGSTRWCSACGKGASARRTGSTARSTSLGTRRPTHPGCCTWSRRCGPRPSATCDAHRISATRRRSSVTSIDGSRRRSGAGMRPSPRRLSARTWGGPPSSSAPANPPGRWSSARPGPRRWSRPDDRPGLEHRRNRGP